MRSCATLLNTGKRCFVSGRQISQMPDMTRFHRIFLSPSATEFVPKELQSIATRRRRQEYGGTTAVVALAGWIIQNGRRGIPAWVDQNTRYLIVADVPEPALVQLPSLLGLHKPHLRLHWSRDTGVVTRLLLAQARSAAWEGIVDAYALGETLVVVAGDLTCREFPRRVLPRIGALSESAFGRFELDPAGSYLYWPDQDVHLGVSQLLQAVDPMFLADVEIERYAKEKVSLALLGMRQERGLKQSDIPGLSDRHVRRLENEETRLTVEAAEKLADAFGMHLSEFLQELGERLSSLRDDVMASEALVQASSAG